MSKLKFYRDIAPIGSVEFERYLGYGGDIPSIEFLQPVDRSDGGDYYIYNKGTPENELLLNFTRMTDLDYNALMNFLTNVVGSKYDFIVIDPTGNGYTCFLAPGQKLSFPLVSHNRRSGQLLLIVTGVAALAAGAEATGSGGNAIAEAS